MLVFKIIFATKLIIGVLSKASSSAQLKVHVGTWNVDAQNPGSNIDELMGLKNGNYDLILLGLQEIVSPSLSGACKKIFFGEKWSKALDDKFKAMSYTKVEARTMFGIGNYVYISASNYTSINANSIKHEEVKMGLFNNTIANKGGIIISFELSGKGFTVISSHLAAHYEQNEKRVSGYKRIYERTKTLKNDFMFWYGDLNFRVEKNINDILTAIDENKYTQLLEHDQLKLCQKNNSVFDGWSEGEITFKPTFKYENKKNTYNKKRRPSWTDRILYKPKHSISLQKYQRLEYQESDHRPVIADFTVTV